jgi:hypothetical protein
MSSFLCKFCGQVWLQWSPEHKAVIESGEEHNCPKAPWNLAKRGKVRARAYKKSQLKKLDDFAILTEIHEKVRFWRSRLVDYTLDFHIDKKLPEGEEA